jgi:MSHA biogenesis protein MshJ
MNTQLPPQLQQQLQQWKERFEALSIRERFLVTIATAAILYMLCDNLFLAPIQTKKVAMVTQMEQLNLQISELQQQIELISNPQGDMANNSLAQQIDQVHAELKKIKKQQDVMANDFIAPAHMTHVLKSILKENGLRLISLKSNAAQPLFATMEKADANKTVNNSANNTRAPHIYKHGVTLELEGDYFATLKYLHSLESQELRFYWDEVDYHVTTYPLARVTIVLYTLSLEKDWIGV